MALYNAFNSWGWLESLDAHVLEEVEVVFGDVRDETSVDEFVHRADVVYHLAALIAIPYSYRAPRSYLDTNARGTLNVLEAVRRQGIPRLVCTSTSEVYGTAQQVPITEDHPLHGQSPYSATKIAADKLAEAYHLSFGLPVAVLRPFNTFGPRQSTRAVIPSIITQLAAGEGMVRIGALDPTRDFTFVTDTASAFIAVGTAPADRVVGCVLNAGTGAEISIRDLLSTIGRLMDREARPNTEDVRLRPENSEVMRLVCDASRLHEATGWTPEHTLESGLRQTIDWFSKPENLARYKTGTYHL
jgi:NDP-hexose 4,6-dehydratase